MCKYCGPHNRDPGENTWVADAGQGPAQAAFYSTNASAEHQADLDLKRPDPGEE